jgi:trehalose synthase-fused probable maltokinase
LSTIAWIEAHPDWFTSWLLEKRWFGDKSRSISSISTSDLVTVVINGGAYGHIVADVTFEDGGEATYFAPLQDKGDAEPEDALGSPAYLAWLGAGFGEKRTLRGQVGSQGDIRWNPSGSSDADGWAELPARVLSGEQSNTSVLYGDRSTVKIFRKLQAGINPDSEIIAYLSAKTGFAHVPRFEGSIVFDRGDGAPGIELATAQAFVPNQGDCWRWLPGALADSTDVDRSLLLDSIGVLGRRTGELHVALGSGKGEAFVPEPFTQQDAGELERRLSREVHLTSSMLFRQGALSHGESEQLAAGLLAGVMQADTLVGSYRTRVHGDYHLGQVLRTGDDFVIIDFEGEPSRTMAERREKHSPLKDVAGMLRSIDYAVASASVDAEQALMSSLREWRTEAVGRFTSAYLETVRNGGADLVPLVETEFRRSLDLFMIDKALYEVRYELDNRPDWLHIPLGALQEIAKAS